MSDGISLPMQLAGAARPTQRGRADPCIVIIFGANGDLAHRKLFPALFHLWQDGALSEDFAILGVGRESGEDQSFCDATRKSIESAAGDNKPDPAVWRDFASRLHYLAGDLEDRATYDRLREKLAELDATIPGAEGHLFHLAIPPSLYAAVITHLSESGVLPKRSGEEAPPWSRVIIEKPFGHDHDTARELNRLARSAMAEHQIYRIDHYLGKETVQNLLVLRFANLIFETAWNRHYVDHVQITAAETIGIEHRAKYYEQAGVLRDMFQNHLLQLLTLTAMEPPSHFRADAVRDEKVKVLRAIRNDSFEPLHRHAVRGQYGAGVVDGVAALAYRDEENVAAGSNTNTFAAVRFMVDNWRWQGVPFYLRAGKRLAAHATEIAIQFRRPPHVMFQVPDGNTLAANVLSIRIQPGEGMALRFEVKVPGQSMRVASVNMEFDYGAAFHVAGHDAYETLLLDCMFGDQTLFTRSDEAESAWELIDPLIAHWDSHPPRAFPNYASGTWGPAEALSSTLGS